MKKNLISVIVTVYNKESTLKRCLNSILKAKSDNYEIVIINDGSTDSSLKIIEEYSKHYSHITVYNQKHIGISAIRKNIVSYISGKYMLFVDADDTIDSKLILKLCENIKKYEPDIIKFDINEIHSIKDKTRYKLNINKVYNNGKEALLEWNKYNCRYGLFGMYCFKKDIYEKSMLYASFYSLECYEDVANIPKIIYFSKKIVAMDYLGYNYYRTKISITNSYSKKYKLLQFQKAHDNLLDFFQHQLGKDDELYLCIKNYYGFHLKRKTKELDV